MSIINKDKLNELEVNEILQFINEFRKEYDIPDLIYNQEISNSCKENAINLLKSKVQHTDYKSNSNNLSENITYLNYVRNQKMSNIKHIIKKWYSEQKFYDFENEENIKYKACQNFINLVWESNVKCGFWYSYSNGKCVLCMQFSE